METKQARPSSDEYAKRYPIQEPSPERIRRLKAQGYKPLVIDVADGDPAMLKDLKSSSSTSKALEFPAGNSGESRSR